MIYPTIVIMRYIYIYIIGVGQKWRYPNSWMVLETPTQMDDDWGFRHFRKPPSAQEDAVGVAAPDPTQSAVLAAQRCGCARGWAG